MLQRVSSFTQLCCIRTDVCVCVHLCVLLFTRISWSSSSSHSSGSFPHLSLVFWGKKNTHHPHSPWIRLLSINHPSPDLRSHQVISPSLSLSFLSPLSVYLSSDKSPHTKSDSLFHLIKDAHLLFLSSHQL